MEMMQAPTPISEVNNPFNNINANDLKIKEIFKFNDYNLIIGLADENLVFNCSIKENNYQVLKNYDSIISEIPNFKLSPSINSIYNLLIQLFKSDKYEIKDDGEHKVKIIIKLKDLLGNDVLYDIILYQIEIDIKTKMKTMEERIKVLENKVKELTKENSEIKNKVNELYSLYNENNKLKEELQESKLKANNNNITTKGDQFVNPYKDSKIIQNKGELNFILEEIKKVIGKINEIKLIYRATRDGSSINEFHSCCDFIPNTLMLVQTTDGYKFGGFTSTGWNNKKGTDIYDKNAFCFSVNLNKIYNIKKPENAMHLQSFDCRPSFGAENYVFILQKEFLKSKENYVQNMVDYKGETKAYEINGGKQKFCVSEMEVFQIFK